MEGNSPETRAQHVAAGGTVASTGYANLLQELLPSAVVDICFPGDPGANLPAGEALEGYDGVAITGSGLHVYEATPEVTRQIELTRAVLESGKCRRGDRAAVTAADNQYVEVRGLGRFAHAID